MASLTSGYSGRTGGSMHSVHIPDASSNSSGLGFSMPGNGSAEDHCIIALAGMFQQIVNDMKGSSGIFEDFLSKSTRLHVALKATLVASSAFLDAFQRVADVATNARGATKEIGKCLTRMVLRQRSIEAKLKTFTSALMDCLVIPLTEKNEDWKKTCVNMDKEHAKESKKYRQEIKKRSQETMRLQKKVKKASASGKVVESWNDLMEMKRQLQDKEFDAVRQAMIEERSRFCVFVSYLKPFLDEELGMLGEMVHLEEISDSLAQNTLDPFQLPPASLQALLDVKATCSTNSPPGSADVFMQESIYGSSCGSESNQWSNYMSPPDSPLPGDSMSPRATKMSSGQEMGSVRDHSKLTSRHGSICSISNASESSFGSSAYSENIQDKTLCPAALKTYRRSLSENNGQEQHYYPCSVASSIPENGNESDAEENSNNDTLVASNQKRRTRRTSQSNSEEIPRHLPHSLALRNEYYNTIRFSSISSGDSGFISHTDRTSTASSRGEPRDSPDSLLTPTTNQEPHPIQEKIYDYANNRGVYGSVGKVEGAQRPDESMYENPYRTAKYAKRPPLREDLYQPVGMKDSGMPRSIGSADLRRTCHLPESSFKNSEGVYGNANMSDTASLPPPPDNWMEESSLSNSSPDPNQNQNCRSRHVPQQVLIDQMDVSMTIRRVKREPETQSIASMDLASQNDVVFRNQSGRQMQMRPHSQYGSTTGVNKPPPPPLPVRRTPSLHQSLHEMDDHEPVALPDRPSASHTRPSASPTVSGNEYQRNQTAIANGLRNHFAQRSTSGSQLEHGVGRSQVVMRSATMRETAVNVRNDGVDVRACLFQEIRGGIALKKVNPAVIRDRSSPSIRR